MPPVQQPYCNDLNAQALELGQRIADLLATDPHLFTACAEGLALGAVAFRDHIRRDGQTDAISAEVATAALIRSGWAARPSPPFWLFDPDVFGLDFNEDCLPSGLRDLRSISATRALSATSTSRQGTGIFS